MKKFVLFFLIILLNSCCGFQGYNYSPDAQIRKEIVKRMSLFDEFHITGIANLQIDEFELKSSFSCRKKDDKFRIDFLSGGVFGLSPKPKLQIVNNDSLNIFIPDQSVVYCFSNLFVNTMQNFRTAVLQADIQTNGGGDIILEVNKQSHLIFNRNYDLLSIEQGEIGIYFVKYKDYLPNEITVKYLGKTTATFSVDRWKLVEQRDDPFDLQIPAGTQKIDDISKMKRFFNKVSR